MKHTTYMVLYVLIVLLLVSVTAYGIIKCPPGTQKEVVTESEEGVTTTVTVCQINWWNAAIITIIVCLCTYFAFDHYIKSKEED